MADEAIGAVFRKLGFRDGLVKLTRNVPEAEDIFRAKNERTEEAVYQLGMAMYDRNLPRSQENEAIKLIEAVNNFTDEELGVLAKTYAQNIELTGGAESDNLKVKLSVFLKSAAGKPKLA